MRGQVAGRGRATHPKRWVAPRKVTIAAALAGVIALVLLAWFGVRPLLRADPEPPGVRGARLTSSYPNLIADQGNSVPLPDGRMLWIFADTAQTTGSPRFFVTSSAAVAERDALSLRYLKDGHGRPVEFLPRTAAERRATTAEGYLGVWPTGATVLSDRRVLIAYTKYWVSTDQTRFTFRAAGLYAYEYPGPDDLSDARPARRIADDIWSPQDGAVASPVRAGRYVYFSQCNREQLRCYSLRVRAEELAQRGAYRWWTGSGWSADRSRRQAMRYGSGHPGRNPPTRHLPEAGLYVTVDTPAGIPATTGLIWVARRPWGPWSEAARFTLPGCREGEGCYTLNAHPEAQVPEGTLRVSYATLGRGPHVLVADVPIELGPRGSWVHAGRND